MNCKYDIKDGNKNITWQELYQFVLDKSKNTDNFFENLSIQDLVFSKTIDTKALYDQIKALKDASKLTAKRRSEVDGITRFNPSADGDLAYAQDGKRILTLQQLVDMDIYKDEDGRRHIVPLQIDDYKKELIAKKIEIAIAEGISKEEAEKNAEKEVNALIDHWQQIEKDSTVIHILSTDFQTYDYNGQFYKFKNKVLELSEDESPFESEDVEKALFKDFQDTYKYNIKGKYPESKALHNINLQELIQEYKFELIGHIDHLIIGTDGAIHIYNYKVSGTTPYEWSSLKEEKYKHEIALLKWMLLKKLGINPNKIEIKLIPVQLEYNEETQKIKKVTIYGDNPKQYDLKKGSYSFLHYDNAAKSIIKPPTYIKPVTDETTQRADDICKIIFPDLGITAEAITRSAEEWIAYAGPNTDFIRIKKIDEVGHSYDVKIGDTVYKIKDPSPKTKNEEILNLVKEHLKEIDDNKGKITQAISDVINKGYQMGFESPELFDNIPGFYGASFYLKSILSPYFKKNYTTKEYDWERIGKDDARLVNAGIFLFKHKKSGQIDVITISPHSISATKKFRRNQKNLLGMYKMDTEVDMLKGDYGNIETIRTLVLLNEILPDIEMHDGKLGDIKVISPQNQGKARIYATQHIVKKYMPVIFKLIREKGSDLNIQNNFRGIDFMDPVESALNYFVELTKNSNTYKKDEDLLREAETNEEKLLAIRSALQSLLQETGTDYLRNIARNISSNAADDKQKVIAALTKAYLYYSGLNLRYETEWSTFINFYGNMKVPDWNIRLVLGNYVKTVDIISEETENFYDLHLRSTIMEFYESLGYGKTKNELVGNQLYVYQNLYERDENGRNTLVFKNPYSHKNDPTYLNDGERKFLKRALFIFAKQRYANFDVESEDDEEAILKFIEKIPSKDPDYFWVPLRKASAASTRQSLKTLTLKARKFAKAVSERDLSEAYRQLELDVSTEEQENAEFGLAAGLRSLQTHSPFKIGDNPRSRQNYINDHEPEFFETNVETLLIDYAYHRIAEDRLNEMLVGTRAILLNIELMGLQTNDEVVTSKELDYIIKYVQRNVFNQSIISKTGQQIISVLSPVKTFVTYANLALNMVSFNRDLMNGFLENYSRTVDHFQTDLTKENVSKAYLYVFRHAFTSSMAVSLLSKLCVKYRLSNVDMAKITEGLNSNRTGIVRFDNLAFSTLRKPDFINRMVLFVARCMQDGVWDAYSMDGDTLVYDWKKDKRFSLLTKDINTLSDDEQKEYYKQRKLYRDSIARYNQEHPSAKLSDDYTNPDEKGLPEPYSQAEILRIKDVANNIYGAYDTGLKNMLEHTGYGWAFAMYTTWMGGIWNNWFTKTDVYDTGQTVKKQEMDEDGNLLYLDKDGNVTTDSNNGQNDAIMTDVPMIIQGMHYTICDLFYILKDDGFQAMKAYAKGNEMVKLNLVKVRNNALLWLLLHALYVLIFTPGYNEYKKNMAQHPAIVNLLVEILYKSGKRSYDSFAGPMNLIMYIGDNMNPPVYEIPVRTITDAGKTIFGERTWGQFFTNNFAIARVSKDTYNAWRKANED